MTYRTPRRLDELPHTELAALLAAGSPLVAILPVGATEAHGPHLPLSTDVIISEGIAEVCALQLSEDARCTPLVMPPIAYTPAAYASEFSGTINLRPETLAMLLDDIGASLKAMGIACLAIANSHFDPANVGVLRSFTERMSEAGLPVAFADATRRKLAQSLSDEFKSGDCHGGQFESSIVLAQRPDLVRTSVLRGLPANPAGLINAIQEKGPDARFGELGMDQAYCGSPASATESEGRESLSLLGSALRDAVLSTLFSTSA